MATLNQKSPLEEPQLNIYFYQILHPRESHVMMMRADGMTLDSIGEPFGTTRERIRQIEKKTITKIRASLPVTIRKIEELFASNPLVSREQIAEKLSLEYPEHIPALLYALDYEKFDGPVSGQRFWASIGSNVSREFDDLVFSNAPCHLSTVLDQCLPIYKTQIAVLDLLGASNKLKLLLNDFVIRKNSKDRDYVYLLLAKAGEGLSLSFLASKVGIAVRALGAQLVRDGRFFKQPETGNWELSEWGNEPRCSSVYEALDSVLERHGAQDRANLIRLACQLYPRSAARYHQVLESEKYGLTKAGKWDFTSNGAKQMTSSEPKKNSKVEETDGGFVRIRVKADSELLRGSGVPVHRRLTWVMGLKQPTKELVFHNTSFPEKPITLYRTPGSHHMSALKSIAESFGLKVGCSLEIAFDKHGLKVAIRPDCACHRSENSS